MIRYVVMVEGRATGHDWEEYSGVEHKTLREAMHELAVAKTDRSVDFAHIKEREVIKNDNR